MGTLDAVTDGSFDSDVIQSDKPVLIDFWATWCRPCQMIAPLLEEIANTYSGKVKVLKMNIEESTQTPSKYGVRGIPTLMVFKGGKLVATKAGFMTKTQISEFLDSHI